MWFARTYDALQAGSIDGTDIIPHDHAVKRALNSHYVPPRHLRTDPDKTIFVGRLNHATTEESLRASFERYGTITHLHLPCNIVTGTSQGYAFITYKHRYEARDAYEKGHRTVLDEHVILVDYERSRTMKGWVPRRLGGGYSGNKESGQLRFGGRDKPFRWPTKRRDVEDPVISQDQRRSDTWRVTKKSEQRNEHKRQRSTSPSPRSHSSRYRHLSSRSRSPPHSHRYSTSSRKQYHPSYHGYSASPRRHHR
ncbi:RNA-binding domain-containing protein [Lichtheimia hyalospora FSU 10163]|nr:RNA-binding domain-containing protein [Lichtheimia hyalospora FSU 10163]